MYTAIRKYRIKSNSDDLVRLTQTEFVPLVRQIPGFVAYYWVEYEPNGLATISVFNDKAGADESIKRAAEWVSKSIADFIDGPPEVTEGETRVHS